MAAASQVSTTTADRYNGLGLRMVLVLYLPDSDEDIDGAQAVNNACWVIYTVTRSSLLLSYV